MFRLSASLFSTLICFCLSAQHEWPLSSERHQHILDRWALINKLDSRDALNLVNPGQVISQALYLDTTKHMDALDVKDLRLLVAYYNLGLTYPRSDTIQSGETSALSTNPYIVSRQPILKHFYRTPAHFYEVNIKDFQLRVNPIINGLLGKSSTSSTFLNQRGFKFEGQVDHRLFFAMQVVESQAQPPDYVLDAVTTQRSYPGEGLYKSYQSSFWGVDKGYDYLNAQGFLGYQASKHFQVQVGHGRQFIGHGLRSLLLSDFSNNYFYLRFNTKVWKFHYQNLWAELTPISPNFSSGDLLLPKKYFAAHYLSLKPTRNLELGLFETVVFDRKDQFELQYLNPLILYRSVEHALGSPDNVLIGLSFNWSPWRKTAVYGQLIMDEFKLDELFSDRGWWANKYGLQAGVKLFDILLPHLDLIMETNWVRPFTYSHYDSIANYSHYLYPLAHPLGSNFKEVTSRLIYSPAPRWRIQWDQSWIRQGRNEGNVNYGANVLWTNTTRLSEYGHHLGQGISTTIWWNQFQVDYELFPQCYLFASGLWRKENTLNYNLVQAGISLNLEPRKYIF